MSRIVFSMSMSLDGYSEGPGREIDWHMVDEELHEHFNERLASMGAFLDGRVTWELMADVWPAADADPESSPSMREFARIWLDMPKIVYSRTLTEAGWNSTIVRDVVPDEVAALKRQYDTDLAVGGAKLAATFRELDLIDEYSIYVYPVLIGRGRPLFQPVDPCSKLRLEETRTFGNGTVLLRYARS